ncbi:MAG: YncE family protein, partial [Propionibacteriaceae bacterium]|nr:YncE family protein [Propionibacteriaceae bacterium]
VMDTTTNQVVGRVRVGRHPRSIAVDPASGRVYVANTEDGSVSVIETSTGRVQATIEVGSEPTDLAVDSERSRVYVAATKPLGIGALWVIDGTANEVVATIDIGDESAQRQPFAVTVDAVSERVYVAAGTDDRKGAVVVIDGGTGERLATIPIDAEPSDIAIDPASQQLFVTSWEWFRLTVLDISKGSELRRINELSWAYDLVLDESSGRAYILRPNADEVSVVDTATIKVIDTLAVAVDGASAMAYDAFRERLYVASYLGSVTVVQL